MNRSVVMVVDDEEPVRHVLSVLLTRAGYEVDVAEDGRAAIARLHERPYDAIITDYRMPGMNGIELAAQGRQLQPETPIIVMSGEVSTPTGGMVSAGVYAWLSKPIDQGQLLQLLRAAICESVSARLPVSHGIPATPRGM